MPEYHTRLVPHHGGTQPQSRGIQPNQNKLDINYYAKYVNWGIQPNQPLG